MPQVRRCRIRIATALLALCMLPAARGSEIQNHLPNIGPPGFSLGAGFLSQQLPYAGYSRANLFVPLVFYNRGRLFLSGLTAGYSLVSHPGWEINLLAEPELLHHSAFDSAEFAGMGNRLPSLMGGGEIAWAIDHGTGEARVSVLTDLLGRNRGQLANLLVYVAARRGALLLIPALGLTWQSHNFVDYYYGVLPGEALGTRPAYTGQASFIAFVRLTWLWQFDRRWSLFLRQQSDILGPGIKDSPLVNRSGLASYLLGLSYHF